MAARTIKAFDWLAAGLGLAGALDLGCIGLLGIDLLAGVFGDTLVAGLAHVFLGQAVAFELASIGAVRRRWGFNFGAPRHGYMFDSTRRGV